MKEIFVCKTHLLDDKEKETYTTTWHDKHMAQEISFYDMTSLSSKLKKYENAMMSTRLKVN